MAGSPDLGVMLRFDGQVANSGSHLRSDCNGVGELARELASRSYT
jgi:hypothetical protein